MILKEICVLDYEKRLFALRNALLAQGFRSLWLTNYNRFGVSAHVSEGGLIPWLSGFEGSSSRLLLTEKKAFLITDDRYADFAAHTLDPNFFDVIRYHDNDIEKLFLAHLSPSSTLAFDPWCLSVRDFNNLKKWAPRMRLRPLKRDPFQHLPGYQNVRGQLDPFYCLKPREKHFLDVYPLLQRELSDRQAFFCSDMASLSWLLGLRGRSVPYIPMIEGYALLAKTGCFFWCDQRLLSKEVRAYLGSMVFLFDLSDMAETLTAATKGLRVDYDESKTPYAVYNVLNQEERTLNPTPNQVLPYQIIKGVDDIKALQSAQCKEGVAWAQLLCEVHQSIAESKNLTEWDVVERLEFYRQKDSSYVGKSFQTISAFGAHAAFIHYHPEKASMFTLTKDNLFLLDAGGHYKPGATTDTTRTILLGDCVEERWSVLYTLVLKGFIAHSTAVFPKGTRGIHLESLARQPLWQEGLDYPHATGHGVGTFLNVHEAPTLAMRDDGVVLQPGMTLTSEPGYYETGHFGIRIENMVTVVKADKTPYHTFRHETLVPLERRLIKKNLLKPSEIAFVDVYHQKVLNTISPLLQNQAVQNWLENQTQPLNDDG